MLNRRSTNLVVLIATLNRLQWLQRSIESIHSGTECDHEIIVIDGGSTDGTVDYLRANRAVTAFFQERPVGTARAYNAAWRQVQAKYTCWLSDDTELVAGSLDLAVAILEGDPSIGMVGLKMRDTMGPFSSDAYLGGVSTYGILTCNHGLLPLSLLQAVGYFNERYRSYTIDADLTASVLCAGRKVVLTKSIAVLHHREWAVHQFAPERMSMEKGGVDNQQIYDEKFKFLASSNTLGVRLRGSVRHLRHLLFAGVPPDARRFGLSRRDWLNLAKARFVDPADPLRCRHLPYHFVHQIPTPLLLHPQNPYRNLGQRTMGSPGAGT